ncbi:hypothetical protein TWF225_004470 [Orbilia oligospora]|uniref:Uncharacterized protein n=1 Tax=Orbilia oligospora TaxID=2813651 RepID=A0A7C8KLL8_ORBOL|nr:hypothetical protein TWF751_005561 [Orbilia oligospora]KAF3186847.1 hypothetical protein TWF225_004470 [Orbilia oligospora]KAF3243499.1 hypothetical protein TWF128_010218 [Orbilia oligospora]KAF3250196.1 hypothetical protein TWF217_008666 [Orbilia oligospora]TGJ73882.1 hypothetical protein EYR41_000948 [Orbilia oligospora]
MHSQRTLGGAKTYFSSLRLTLADPGIAMAFRLSETQQTSARQGELFAVRSTDTPSRNLTTLSLACPSMLCLNPHTQRETPPSGFASEAVTVTRAAAAF